MNPSPTPANPLTFPTEITTEIFKHAISVDFDAIYHDTPPTRDSYTTPLILSAVCQSWRLFVWNVPALWSVIILNMSRKRYKAQVILLKMWLKNSETSPLQIWFDAEEEFIFRMDRDNKDIKRILAAVRQLVEHSIRWETISLCVSGDYKGKFADVLRTIKGRLPVLRAGHFRVFDNWISLWQLDMFEDAPRLNSFAISIHYVEHITLPWLQLTSFCARVNHNECLAILKQCENLEQCTFYPMADYDSEDTPSDAQIINVSRLVSLTIMNYEDNALELILQRITGPALRHLLLTPRDERGFQGLTKNLPFSTIEDLVTRSNCRLEILDLESYSIKDPSSVIRILEKTPYLLKLTVKTERRHPPVSFFDALLERLDISTYPGFLPLLIYVRYITPTPIGKLAHEHLANVLKQRQQLFDSGVTKLADLVVEVIDELQHAPIIEGQSGRTAVV